MIIVEADDSMADLEAETCCAIFGEPMFEVLNDDGFAIKLAYSNNGVSRSAICQQQ